MSDGRGERLGPRLGSMTGAVDCARLLVSCAIGFGLSSCDQGASPAPAESAAIMPTASASASALSTASRPRPQGSAAAFTRLTKTGFRAEVIATRPLMSVNDAVFVTPALGYAVGFDIDSGAVFAKTDDGGHSWAKAPLPLPDRPAALVFLDAAKGFASGGCPGGTLCGERRGALLRTNDGGASWSEVATSATGPLEGLSFASSTVGFASGQGFLLRTKDGGDTWQTLTTSVPPAWDSHLAFPSAELGFVTAGPDQLLRTRDGGDSFDLVLLSEAFMTMGLAPAGGDVLVIGPSSLTRLLNGGRGFVEYPHRPFVIKIAHFVDNATGVIAGVRGSARRPRVVLEATRDGGASWETLLSDAGVSAVSALSFPTPTVGFAVGSHVVRIDIGSPPPPGDNPPPSEAKAEAPELPTAPMSACAARARSAWPSPKCSSTTIGVSFSCDDGKTFAEAPKQAENSGFSAVAFPKPGLVLAIPSGFGDMLLSDDSGCSFRAIGRPPGNEPPVLVAHGNESLVGIGKSGPNVFEVTPEGIRNLTQPPAARLFGVGAELKQSGRMRVADDHGQIFELASEGHTWSRVGKPGSGGARMVYAVAFAPKKIDHAIAGTMGKGAQVTFDGGVTWTASTGCDEIEGNVFDLAFSPVDDAIVWGYGIADLKRGAQRMVRKRRMVLSKDGGRTFRTVDALDTSAGPTFVPDPQNKNQLYLTNQELVRYDARTDRVLPIATGSLSVRSVWPAPQGLIYVGLRGPSVIWD